MDAAYFEKIQLIALMPVVTKRKYKIEKSEIGDPSYKNLKFWWEKR